MLQHFKIISFFERDGRRGMGERGRFVSWPFLVSGFWGEEGRGTGVEGGAAKADRIGGSYPVVGYTSRPMKHLWATCLIRSFFLEKYYFYFS